MTLKYALYGLCFGWVLMPRWRSQGLKVPLSILAYATANIAALLLTCFFDYSQQAWSFTIGIAAQLLLFAALKWGAYFTTNLGRKIRR